MEETVRSYVVYKHTSPSGKVYIGITCQDVARRWRNGGIGYKESAYFFNAVLHYGWNNIVHEILATGLTKDAAESMEIELISHFNLTNPKFGYNLSPGGGATASPSQETRAKLSAAMKDRTVTAETKQKMSAWQKGRTLTAEHRAKISAGHRLAARDVECLTVDGKVMGYYDSVAQAAEKTGIDKTSIAKVCRGKQATAGTLRWRFV